MINVILGTFKLVKTHLQLAGYNTTDPIFIWNQAKKQYLPFTNKKRERLELGDDISSL